MRTIWFITSTQVPFNRFHSANAAPFKSIQPPTLYALLIKTQPLTVCRPSMSVLYVCVNSPSETPWTSVSEEPALWTSSHSFPLGWYLQQWKEHVRKWISVLPYLASKLSTHGSLRICWYGTCTSNFIPTQPKTASPNGKDSASDSGSWMGQTHSKGSKKLGKINRQAPYTYGKGCIGTNPNSFSQLSPSFLPGFGRNCPDSKIVVKDAHHHPKGDRREQHRRNQHGMWRSSWMITNRRKLGMCNDEMGRRGERCLPERKCCNQNLFGSKSGSGCVPCSGKLPK